MNAPVVLITGASRGIGAQLAESFAGAGANVIGVARRDANEWDVSDKFAMTRKVCDITDESAVKRTFSEIRKEHGQLDVVINNAGIFSGDLLLMASADRFASILNANLVAAHVVTREAVKLMRPKGVGRVVSISSIATSISLVGNALYSATKTALEGLMRDYSVEFRNSGITFNSVAVSFLEDSGMVETLKPEARAAYEDRLLVPRAVTIEEIVAAVEYFVSPAASPITGQVLRLGSPV